MRALALATLFAASVALAGPPAGEPRARCAACSLMPAGATGSDLTLSGIIVADSMQLTGASSAGVSLNFTNAAGGMFFNNAAATNGYFVSGTSAANAGATSATSAFKFYPNNVLDATDYVLSVGPQGNGSSLFNVAYSGDANLNGNVNVPNNKALTLGSGSTYNLGSNGAYKMTNAMIFNTAPTISSAFGTSPSVTTSNGTAAFTINVGTGGVATSGVIGLPTATNGWVCRCDDITTASATVFLTKQTASSTTTCTVGNFNTAGAAAAWVASDILHCSAIGR